MKREKWIMLSKQECKEFYNIVNGIESLLEFSDDGWQVFFEAFLDAVEVFYDNGWVSFENEK